jgi:NAD(P)-dependent dehydrogenase (short-subunit alcohol dehydrogenase family)
MTCNLAREVAPSNIRVNCVCPGLIREPRSLQKPALPRPTLARRGQPEDVAYAALFLASDESRWITGQTLVVDGGGEAFVGQPREFD